MKMVRGLAVGMLTAALVGCATPKPELPAEMYDAFSRSWIQVHNCSAAGKISPDTTAWTLRYMTAELHRFNYNQALLDKTIHSTDVKSVQLNPAACKEMEVYVANRKIQTEINNQNAARTEQQIRDAVNSRPTTTYCNKVGTQVLCNSY